MQVDNLSATTDANGDYRIESVVPGAKTVRASKGYFLPMDVPVTIVAGSSTRVDLSLQAIGEIRGRVTDSITNVGVSGVEVTLGPLTSYTAVDGSYYILGIPPGSYWLGFTAAGYSSTLSWLAVPGGVLTTVDRVFDKTGFVSGTVTSAVSAAPVAGATVLGGGAAATSDGTGQYSLTGVSAGSVTLLVTALGYDAKSTVVTVPAGGSAVANFSLAGASTTPANITGHVRNAETSAPLSGVYVSIGNKSATTAGDGSYSLVGVTPDPRAFAYANLSGYLYASFYMAVPGGTSFAQDFTLKPYHTVYVAVSEAATHVPIAGASAGAGGGSCTTSLDGLCSMQAVYGATTLSVSAKGYRSISQPVEIATSAASMLTAELTPVPRVCGFVSNATNTAPLAGAEVDLLIGVSLLGSTITAADGSYCMSCPDPYAAYAFTWTVSASSLGFTNNGTSFQFPPSGTIDVDLSLWPAGTAP